MATIRLEISDELARRADAAGLLASPVIEELLRRQLQTSAGEPLLGLLARLPYDDLDADAEREIVETISAARAELSLIERAESDPAFGIWRDRTDLDDVETWLRQFHRPRHIDNGPRDPG